MTAPNAETVRPKPGPIQGVRYGDDGTVLGFWQPLLLDGREVGRMHTETEAGRGRRRQAAYETAVGLGMNTQSDGSVTVPADLDYDLGDEAGQLVQAGHAADAILIDPRSGHATPTEGGGDGGNEFGVHGRIHTPILRDDKTAQNDGSGSDDA